MTSLASSTAISVRNVRMSYPAARGWIRRRPELQGVLALQDVSFDVPAGGRVALFGENGAGKTTLLKIIAGALIAQGGRVLLAGAGARGHHVARLGYVTSDERSFYWRLSGAENLRFFAALDDRFGAEARTAIAAALERVGLAASAERPVGEYSTGMRQRLALARGLLLDPDVLLLDEPTRSLDPTATSELLEMLRDVTRDRTVLIATNRFEDATELCDAVLVLQDGRVVARRELDAGTTSTALASFVREHLTAGRRAAR